MGISLFICLLYRNKIYKNIMSDVFLFSDTGLLTLSRYILLDCWLLFFILLATHNYVQFIERRDR